MREGRKDPLPDSLPPKNRACDFHRTRLTPLYRSRFHYIQTKAVDILVARRMYKDRIAECIGTAIDPAHDMVVVPSGVHVHLAFA